MDVDKVFARCLGFRDIEDTDYGAVVGRRPDGTIQYIPSPSTKVSDFYKLLEFMLRMGLNVTFSMGENSRPRVEINNKLYEAAELKAAVLKAFLGVMNEKD